MNNNTYEFDLVISFSEEDRVIASGISLALSLYGVKHYYYPEYQSMMNGKDITISLNDIYEHQGRFALVIASDHYVKKRFTTLEYKAIERRRGIQPGYMILVRVGDLDVAKLSESSKDLVYFDWNQEFKPLVKGILLEKLNLKVEENGFQPQKPRSVKKIINQAGDNIFNIGKMRGDINI